MPQKLPTSARYRKSAKRLFLREKSLNSKNPSFTSVSAIIASSNRRGSEYSKQLLEKQKVRRLYGVAESQFKQYYRLSVRSASNTAENILQLLERRLDNTVYRLGFATTRAHARQLVSHGWFSVNDKAIHTPSYRVSVGNVVKMRKTTENFSERPFDAIPGWLELDKKHITAKVLANPTREDSDPDINEQLIVEYYSR